MNEVDLWKTSTKVLATLAIIVGVIQRTQYRFLDPVFELCVFHIPTIISVVIYSRVAEEK